MKLLYLIILVVILFFESCSVIDSGSENEGSSIDSDLTPLSTIEEAFANHRSDIQVLQEGTIIRQLPDDTTGDRHQRLIIRLANDQTLLITHNIDLASRIPNPTVGTTLRFYGEYERNDEGGVIHWTHKDPDNQHTNGWLEYNGKRYQ